MELKEFITETFKAILEANAEVKILAEEHGALLNPINRNPANIKSDSNEYLYFGNNERRKLTKVNFDVAINASNEDSTKGGVGMKLQVFSFGANAENVNANSVTSRIKFEMDIALPYTDFDGKNIKYPNTI